MPPDEHLLDEDELASVLHAYEGPARPTRRRATDPASRFGLRGGALVAAAALLVGSGLGFGIGSSVTPSGRAASNIAGLGFVAESGWSVVQSGADAAPRRPAYAIASNVRLHPDDDARGVQNSSGLPYATLLDLPPQGVVIVATFTAPPDAPFPAQRFPARTLPLRLRDASRFMEYGTQLRPDRPLGEYRLRARVNRRDVDLHFYFGRLKPSKATILATQRQLDRLVVEPVRPTAKLEQRALPLQPEASTTPVTAAANVVDRTLVCTTGVEGGAHNILPSTQQGFRKDGRFQWLAHASIGTPGHPLPTHPDHIRALVRLAAGWPPPVGVRAGEVGYHADSCRPTRTSVALSARGLTGGPAGVFGDVMLCLTPRTVLIRFRVAFHSPTRLILNSKRRWVGATARIDRGQLAVRTPAGKRLAYAEVLDSGKARIFTKGCS